MSETAVAVVTKAFAEWEGGDGQAVFRLMADDLQWTIIGTTQISGHYASKREFLKAVNQQLMPRFAGPLTPTVQRITGVGDLVFAQFISSAKTLGDGPDYEQSYCWVMELDNGAIRSGTAYLDTALIDRVLGADHKQTKPG